MKLLLVIDYVWDYRIPLYYRLSQQFNGFSLLITGISSQTKVMKIPSIKYQFIRNKLKLALALLTRDYDIVIWGDAGSSSFASNLMNGLLCYLISRMRRKPFIVWFGGWEFTQDDLWGASVKDKIKKTGARALIPFILRRANAIITYGSLHKKIYVSLNINPDKIFIAPNSSIIPYDHHEVEEKMLLIKEKLNLNDKKVILYVGRLEKRKNVDILIKAFAQLKRDDVCLLIIGDGKSRPYLEGLCEQLKVRNVYFLGRIERGNLPPYYWLCDVFVYPTSREPWGLAINEAMQFGKPVIATPRVAAAHDLIRQGVNGFIVLEKDVQALAKAISKIISDEGLAKRMGQKSREIAQQGYTYEHMTEGFRQAIKYCYKKRALIIKAKKRYRLLDLCAWPFE
ncbi:MAG: hypothetical protein DRJ47_07870 [Thermoprotei archaeon]|nr:MAG: hypothetical protein DRJ47_07870 [Thermoprotei archaeon]